MSKPEEKHPFDYQGSAPIGQDDDLREIYTVKEIKEYLRIGQVAAYELIHRPDFPVVKIGRTYRIPKAGFLEWLNRQHATSVSLPNREMEDCEIG